MSDQVFRQLATLKNLPTYPAQKTVKQLKECLELEGFNCTVRTVQRDLESLVDIFPLYLDKRSKPYGWSFAKGSIRSSFPTLSISTALTFFLAEQHLKHLLPPSALQALEPEFAQAHRQLDGLSENGLKSWHQRIRSLPNGKTLIPAEIKVDVWDEVANALMEKKQLSITYLSRKKQATSTYTVHPAGIVARHSITYLVARFADSEKYRHFALNRIAHAEKQGQAVIEDNFDLDAHIQAGHFSSRFSSPEVTLVADIHPQLAWILAETPLSAEQHIEPLDNSDWSRLTAKVRMDEETLWWIHALHSQIRVHAPQQWVDQITQHVQELAKMYQA